MDKIKVIIQCLYLALGSIALFTFVRYLGFAIGYLMYNYLFFQTHVGEWLISLPLMFLSGLLLIITFYRFLHSKKYSIFTGLIGCLLFICYSLYWLWWFDDFFTSFLILYSLAELTQLIAAIILLIMTIVYWEKLV